MTQNEIKLNTIIASVLNIQAEVVNDNTSPDNVESWDSYNALMLVSELESGFNVHFTMDEVVAVKCVKDIKEALKRHNVE